MDTCTTANRPYLYALETDKKQVLYYRPDCHLWSCDHCAAILQAKWSHRVFYGVAEYIRQGEEWYFFTLTSSGKLRTKSQTLWVWPKAWAKLYARMKRLKPDLLYASIPEQHRDGRVHMHFIINCGFGYDPNKKGVRWLKDNPAECGLGYMNDIKPVLSPERAAHYATKYLAKGLTVYEWPKGLRRIRTSQKWPKDPAFERETETSYSFQTVFSLDDIALMLADYERRGWDVIDIGTGEITTATDLYIANNRPSN